MFYLPPLRRFLLPSLICLAIVAFCRSKFNVHTHVSTFILHRPDPPPPGLRVPIRDLNKFALPVDNSSENHLSPSTRNYQSSLNGSTLESANHSSRPGPVLNPYLAPLFSCPFPPNRLTGHIRLSNTVHNISMIAPPSSADARVFWNPAILSLPFWSKNQYLIVSRIVTIGLYQQNVLCEANICFVGSAENRSKGKQPCGALDLPFVGPGGGMRCATEPILVNVPSTPAEKCEGKFEHYVNIPGFHDPRIFWTGKGEPLMMVNTHSRYACFGLWIIDIRALYPPLERLLASHPTKPSLGPMISYPTLTELTRNPRGSRFPIEKNWMLFSPGQDSYVHYDISPTRGRTFAKLLGAGLTTVNLTDPLEQACLQPDSPDEPDPAKKGGTWHQTGNSLKLVLCHRKDKACKPNPDNTVFFAAVHRKHNNGLGLPLRYERYFIVWSAVPPFSTLGISQHPLLLANETASGWTAQENWDGDAENTRLLEEGNPGKDLWAYFTYTVSLAYAWGRQGDEPALKNTGFLDDEVILGIGIDDAGQGFAKVKALDLLQCLRACPGRKAAESVRM